jgi:hypothetical protein
LIVTLALAETLRVETEKVALLAPAGTVTLEGVVTRVVLLFLSFTIMPPLGAWLLKVIWPVVELPPITLVGLKVKDDTDKAEAARNAL